MKGHALLAALAATWIAGAAVADTVVTFDGNDAQGWRGPQGPGGGTVIDPLGGNPGANLHTVFNDFGITFRNDTNAEFIGDYTRFATVTLGIDVQVELIDFFDIPVSRPWLVELRDYDDPPGGYPFVSVWFKFADVSAASHGDWTPFEVTIADTASVDLPPGWGGTGAEDPETFEPMLPKDRTFTSVLSGVDEAVFTTLEPGFFFGFTDFDVRIDNIAIATAGVDVVGAASALAVDRAATPGELILSWLASCGSLAQDYAIYEGLIGDWPSHTRIDCSDDGGDSTEQVLAGEGDRYYLVVPLATFEEGSYGRDSSLAERPRGTTVCRFAQDMRPCD